jgi:TRAP-type C4-dicarboxylate transport system permease large subunit
MIGAFLALAVAFKIPLGVSLALSALAGALLGGQGFAVRHLVEGAFGFFDIILLVASAMIFMRVLQEGGLLDRIVALILRTFHRSKAALLLMVMLIVMFPGMITGSSLAAVLSTGPIVAPVLIKLGLPRLKAAAFIAMGAILGMIAPPVNILVMIMAGGVDMPYVGLTAPLLLITVPVAVFSALWLGYRDLRIVGAEELKSILPSPPPGPPVWRMSLPLLVVVLLLVLQNVRGTGLAAIGLPAVFFIGSLAGWLSGRRFNFFAATQRALRDALPLLSILAGVGMFLQIMTLTGVRGWAVLAFLSLPPALLYAGIAVSLPLFGGISSFGSASVLGVPFMLALISKNALLTSSALSAIVGIGDLMPPAAMAARFSAQAAGEKNFTKVLRHTLVPAAALLAAGLGMLLASPFLEKFL